MICHRLTNIALGDVAVWIDLITLATINITTSFSSGPCRSVIFFQLINLWNENKDDNQSEGENEFEDDNQNRDDNQNEDEAHYSIMIERMKE